MSRYTNDIAITGSVDEAMEKATEYLTAEGFKLKEGGTAWKKGMGLMLGPQFLQVDRREDGLHLEAWIKFAILPGWYVGEMGLDGVFAIIPKRKLKKRVEALEELLEG
ncbi:MAG: hypothetical protein JRF33_24235 [Deltaproteobacteria bacterium]|nr:hypothetical protein [Deltaproteobacteria bacterium]